jgi:hypothetical protein
VVFSLKKNLIDESMNLDLGTIVLKMKQRFEQGVLFHQFQAWLFLKVFSTLGFSWWENTKFL